MKTAALVVPGSLDSPTGGYIYDRRVAAGLRERGWQVDVVEIDGSFPHPTPGALTAADAALRDRPDHSVVMVDGLAFGSMPSVVTAHAERLCLVPVVHLPLAEDVGLDPKIAARLEAEERLSLESARLVIVTGESTRDVLLRYGVRRNDIVLAEPGVDLMPLGAGTGSGRLSLLCVATLNPGKGHALLMRALASAPHRQWHLICVGSLTRHPATVADVRRLLGEHDLLDHVSLAGEFSDVEISHAYAAADLFVLPTLKETYGMAVSEAIAHGVPVISTTTGAIPAVVGRRAGLLTPPGDEAAFTAALHRALADEPLRRELRAGAREARARLRPWRDTFDKIASALDDVLQQPTR